jgi:hypothetical protein
MTGGCSAVGSENDGEQIEASPVDPKRHPGKEYAEIDEESHNLLGCRWIFTLLTKNQLWPRKQKKKDENRMV